MTDAAASSPNPQDNDLGGLAETRLHNPAEVFSQQEEDIALVAELLAAGSLSERQIAAVMANWSIHGSVSLARHIQNQGLLDVDDIQTLVQRAKIRVQRARDSVSEDSIAPASGESLFLATLERIDGTGRVSRLLGVTVASGGGHQENRDSDARYQLIRKLGQGGLGRVWLAIDRNLNRFVALKEIAHPTRATESIINRFIHEAEITGRLEHPGIVPVYHLGKDSQGRTFYTMRFLGKTTLQDSITEYHERREAGDHDPMLLRHLLNAFVKICHAIGHAHSRKVIHRDLKPENIVIDSFGQVIVIDWGLAKVLDETNVENLADSNHPSDGARTGEGQVMGTPLYMSPEQAAGRLDEVDERTDIYGLGSILFSIITGYAPHEQTQQASVDSGTRGLITLIAGGETPSARDLNPAADPALTAICAKAMAHRRYARYQQSADLGEEIQRWMAGESVTAYQEPFFHQVRRWIARHQGLSQALAAVMMVVLVAMTTLGMAARQNYIDIRQTQFSRMEANVREVEIQLRDVATELAKDARFVASLPPIQGIVNARSGIEGDDEDVWRDRLESIFTGLLRSNPDYLALSYVAKTDNGSEEIVRVERNPADPTFVARLPLGRLHSAKSDSLMTDVATSQPGDVQMTMDTRPRFQNRSDQVDRLAVATPIYDEESGKCFGMALIEADIARYIEDVLLGLGYVECEVNVAEGDGQLRAAVDRVNGVRIVGPNETIDNLPKEVVYELESMQNAFQLEEDGSYIAKRFYIDPDSKGLFIFARLPD